ncbi:FAD-binding oxidoreductase [Rossellomorea marisflavi]|uniref:FAD-binding oxidoreductase n=1 Tax=Rossellomorea marisflavi TaxID=189381 RepID=UPI0034582161
MYPQWINELIEEIGTDGVTINETALLQHSHDESHHPGVSPEVVASPKNTEQVATILRIASRYGIPVTPYGAGSGLDGGAIPLYNGISLVFTRMDRILHFSPEDMSVTVQPGITRLALNKQINRHGLHFPIDPGADASIGGMTATNASGTTAVRYGSMRDQVLDLEVVLADGRVIHTGSRAKKSSSGYHLNGLFTGSEGTLGIITGITLKLHGTPEHLIAARCTFPSPKACAEAAHLILMSGIPVQRIELVDSESIRQVNAYGQYAFPEEHSLFFEFVGTKGGVEEEASLAEELMKDAGCSHWKRAVGSKERSEIWRARHELSYAFSHIPGKKMLGSDVCVPLSHLADLVVHARTLIEDSGLLGGVFGHVGDGNFHTSIVYDPKKPHEREKALHINEELVLKALGSGGTCTGEHGVGIGKKKYQVQEHGEAAAVMASFKHLLDPEGILNPGKIFD